MRGRGGGKFPPASLLGCGDAWSLVAFRVFFVGQPTKRNTVSLLATMDPADSTRNIDLPPLLPTPSQVRQARAVVRMGQRELAALAGVAVTTLNAYEQDNRPPFESTVAKLRVALEQLGFRFDPDGTVRRDQ